MHTRFVINKNKFMLAVRMLLLSSAALTPVSLNQSAGKSDAVKKVLDKHFNGTGETA
ncbi:hypothetical protein [Pantoea wallisii]|uniref:hypothetical protein n=1 Tax=Pantoea wallisii TaxID=1076551 RepID=UPI001301BE2C|nr:hypothetical protein [Pantoea wallisii]